jgi:hypothetical protein
MLVIFHVITCQNFNLPHIYCIFGGKFSLFDMNFFELITQYPNVIQTMWNDVIQYTFNFHKD